MRLLCSLFVVAALFSSCCRTTLRCRSELLDPLYLAGEQIETPDPHRRCFYGQQVIVSWNLPPRCLYGSIELVLQIRLRNLEIKTMRREVCEPKGYWVYRVMNEEFLCSGGIEAFQAQMYRDGELIDCWTHCLWTPLIEISPSL